MHHCLLKGSKKKIIQLTGVKTIMLKKFIEHFVTQFLLKIQNYFEAFNCETNGSHERFNFCMRKMIKRMSKIL